VVFYLYWLQFNLITIYIAAAAAAILDSFSLMRLERAFSKYRFVSSFGLLEKLNGLFLLCGLLSLLTILCALWLGNGHEIAVLFVFLISRHIFNVFRMAVAQLDYLTGDEKVAIQSSSLRIASNLCICIVPLICSDYYYIHAILLVGALETCVVLFWLMQKTNFAFKLGAFASNTRKIIAKPNSSGLMYGCSSAVSGSFDRLLIGLLLPETFAIIYLKYKLVSQILDGGFSVVGYRVHLDVIQSNVLPSFKTYVAMLMYLAALAVFAVAFAFDITTLKSVFVIGVIMTFLVLKRLVDGTLGSLLVAHKKYTIGLLKVLMESFIFGFLCLFMVYVVEITRGDYMFIAFTFSGVVGSIFLIYRLYKNGVLRV